MTDLPIDLRQPSRVTVGTVGPVGERVFLLQAREGDRLVTMKVEKQQIAAVANLLGRMLRELARPQHLPEGDELALEAFEEVDLVVGALGLSYDEVSDRVVLVVDEFDRVDPSEEDEEAFGATEPAVRLMMTREHAAALAIRITELVEAGRPPCPLCGYPLDPRGHACPRTNGNRAPRT